MDRARRGDQVGEGRSLARAITLAASASWPFCVALAAWASAAARSLDPRVRATRSRTSGMSLKGMARWMCMRTHVEAGTWTHSGTIVGVGSRACVRPCDVFVSMPEPHALPTGAGLSCMPGTPRACSSNTTEGGEGGCVSVWTSRLHRRATRSTRGKTGTEGGARLQAYASLTSYARIRGVTSSWVQRIRRVCKPIGAVSRPRRHASCVRLSRGLCTSGAERVLMWRRVRGRDDAVVRRHHGLWGTDARRRDWGIQGIGSLPPDAASGTPCGVMAVSVRRLGGARRRNGAARVCSVGAAWQPPRARRQ
jgi:hypothetical protein